jgi:hypothetical protein
MPGSRGKDFRGGDLAEGLGLELLRPFAFIAPVPRPEDVGIDAVATMFRRDKDRLIAEDSFLVQAKAASSRKIRYVGGQLDWLRALKLPFFWLSVDLATTTVELWSTIRAAGHPNFPDRQAVTIYLDERPFDISGDEMHVWLEEPILRWTPADASDELFQQTAYEVLRTWIQFEMRCLAVRPLGMTLPITWETNRVPQQTGAYAIMHHPSQLTSVLEKIQPYMQTLATLAISNWPTMMGSAHDSTDELLLGLLLVSDYMRQQGVDPDPNGILRAFVHLRQRQQETLAKALPAESTITPDGPAGAPPEEV